MKSLLTLCLAVAVFAGCGGSDQSPTPTPAPGQDLGVVEAEVTELDRDAPEHEGLFPAPDFEASQERGYPVVLVEDQAEAERLCVRAQTSPPFELAGATQVAFDVSGTGADVTCMLPAG
jgi:hypothetical protein